MKNEILLDAIGNIDDTLIHDAISDTPKRKASVWVKIGAMAACLAVVVLSFGYFQGGWFPPRAEVVTLPNGETLVFQRSNTVGGAYSLAFEVSTKPLTTDETTALFGSLPITATAIYRHSDVDADTPQELIGFEGRIGTVKAVISTSDVPLLDTVIIGTEETSSINGVSVVAGYMITKPNSKGEQNAIYYASFALGRCKVYLENAGAKNNRKATKNQLAGLVKKLIENGEPNVSSRNNE